MDFNIKEMADLIGVSEYKFRKALVQVGIDHLQSEAERLSADEKFNHPDGPLVSLPPPEIRHFKSAFDDL